MSNMPYFVPTRFVWRFGGKQVRASQQACTRKASASASASHTGLLYFRCRCADRSRGGSRPFKCCPSTRAQDCLLCWSIFRRGASRHPIRWLHAAHRSCDMLPSCRAVATLSGILVSAGARIFALATQVAFARGTRCTSRPHSSLAHRRVRQHSPRTSAPKRTS